MVGKPIAITSSLVEKVRALKEYGLSLKQIGQRLGIAESSAHKIVHTYLPLAWTDGRGNLHRRES